MNATAPAINSPPAKARVNYAWPWQPDCDDGVYCNPVLYADYSDADVIRAGHVDVDDFRFS